MLRGERLPGDRWTEHDSTLAVALTLYEAGTCSGCGHQLSETTDTLADPFHPERTHWFEAETPVVCHACAAVGARVKEYEGDDRAQALHFRATKVTPDDEGKEVT